MYDSVGAGAVWQEGLLAARARGMTSSVIRDLLALTSRPDIISLAGGLPDEAALPAQWLRGCADTLLAAEGPALLQYSTTEGDPQLRELIARWESDWCGRSVSADDVLVTSGSQQALDLLAKVLIEPGDVLVTRSTSPYFNVVLPMLGAIVTDRGGALSHAAIVAREYGIPCVVGAVGATSRITTGDTITVDGDAGTVTIVAGGK